MAHQLENSKPQEYSLAQASSQTGQTGVTSPDDFKEIPKTLDTTGQPSVPDHDHPHEEHLPASHGHPADRYILGIILIVIFFLGIYQYFAHRRTEKLERDLEKLHAIPKHKPNNWFRIFLAVTTIIPAGAGILGLFIQPQTRNPAPSQQQTSGAAHSEDSGLEDALAALHSSERPVTQPTTVLTKVSFSTPSQEQLETGITFSDNLPTTGTGNSP
ncbi:DUF308 domain-containing protein [Candidatus Synechococcus spongiarum]|uniref:DUF308 domain-containing protein n=1 Tax=Candidatus Synechococcus spongiarum TaxID=431041 RepID=UPI001177E448|nr:DUF308 domain-containing protein [Candidatus Synechococcus spongiarum]